MTRGLIFWVMMLMWLLSLVGALAGWNHPEWGFYLRVAPNVFAFILFALLGWQVFGPAIKG